MATKKATPVSIEEYEEAYGSDLGFCTACEGFTRDMTEPDATDYDCPDCEQATVIGAELAVVTGRITVGHE